MLMPMQPPAHAIECLKSHGLHTVWLVQPPGRGLRTLKTWPLTPWMFVKLALGIAQPQRQMRGMRRLRRAGVHTPQCCGSWRARFREGQPLVEVELEYAPGITAGDLMSGAVDPASLSGLDRASMIRAASQVGAAIGRMAAGRAFHRDLKPSNVVLELSDAHRPRVWIIDTVGVRIMRHRAVEVERMLERIALQPLVQEQSLARAIRIAALHAALRTLSRGERMEVFRLMRLRAQGHGRRR